MGTLAYIHIDCAREVFYDVFILFTWDAHLKNHLLIYGYYDIRMMLIYP